MKFTAATAVGAECVQLWKRQNVKYNSWRSRTEFKLCPIRVRCQLRRNLPTWRFLWAIFSCSCKPDSRTGRQSVVGGRVTSCMGHVRVLKRQIDFDRPGGRSASSYPSLYLYLLPSMFSMFVSSIMYVQTRDRQLDN